MKVLVTVSDWLSRKVCCWRKTWTRLSGWAFGRNLKLVAVGEGPLVELLEIFLPENVKFLQPAKEWCSGACWCPLNDLKGPCGEEGQTNVVGKPLVTADILACRLVYISSPEVYAAARTNLVIKEEGRPAENELSYYIAQAHGWAGLSEAIPQVPWLSCALEGFGIGDTSIFPRFCV